MNSTANATANSKNKEAILRQEREEALSVIDVAVFSRFLYENHSKFVGKDRNGNPTRLIEEVGEVARMAHRAYVGDGVVNYYKRNAFSLAELNEDEKEFKSRRMYTAAAKKILFLVAVCSRTNGGKSFLKVRIDKEDIAQARLLVDAFEWLVRHYDEFTD